jgi:phage I-like protein
MRTVKQIAFVLFGGRHVTPPKVALLDSERAIEGAVAIDLLAAMGQTQGPPEWVRFLAPGVNRARDGRSFTVADPAKVVQLSNQYKGGIELLVDFEHQFDRAKDNGKPAPAAAWIKELSAAGPDGTPGIWAKIDWLPDTTQLIRDRKYRYLSAAVAHDDDNNVLFVPRASLTNQPAMDTATALFSTRTTTKENDVNALMKALLAALGLPDTTPEADAQKLVVPLAALSVALAKTMGVELAALSAMTADQVKLAFAKPLADKLATLATTAKVAGDATADQIVAGIKALGVDPAQFVPKSVYDDVSTRLATLAAETTGRQIEEAKKAGKITPAMEEWAKSLTPAQLTAFLATAPVIAAPAGDGKKPGDPANVAQLSAEDKAAARAAGVSDESYLAAKQVEAADAARRKAQLA